MSAPSVVLIAAAEHLAGLTERVGDAGPCLAFGADDAREALEAVRAHRPARVVVERYFAATPRGAALVDRISEDPDLADIEISLVSHDSGDSQIARTPSPRVLASPAAPLDHSGTRRAPRYTLQEGVTMKVDGNPARVIDMSRLGAQIVVSAPLRPYQRVRVTLTSDDATVRCVAAIAWCRFELATAGGGHYRAGLEFATGQSDAIERFGRDHAAAAAASAG